MDQNIPILIIDPDSGFVEKTLSGLNQLGFQFISTLAGEVPIEQFAGLSPIVAILGPGLDPQTCLKCLNKLKILDLSLPVLICRNDGLLSGGKAEVPFECVYYLPDGLMKEHFMETLEQAFRDKREFGIRPDFPVLIGQSVGIRRIREKIQRVSDKDITILVTGETGTGKELIARSVHFHSLRSKGPLVKINCSALPDELLESEVFGFQRGAFTGAHKNKPGRIELADGGTLFVDEIGDLSLNLQVKFLQVLEDKAFSRLGGTEDKTIDARVVAATNADLARKVREGTFRMDLYYRLNVVRIEAPPLRERMDDIPLLIHFFLGKYCHEFKREAIEVPDPVLSLFYSYSWPGNIRELENILRRAIAVRDWGFVFDEIQGGERTPGSDAAPFRSLSSTRILWSEEKIKTYFAEKNFSLKRLSKAYISEVEREAILDVLKQTHWNRKQAAELLNVSYKTLLNRIIEFDLKP